MRVHGIPYKSGFLKRGEFNDKITFESIELARDIIDCLTVKDFRWDIKNSSCKKRIPVAKRGECPLKIMRAPRVIQNEIGKQSILRDKALEDLTLNMLNNSVKRRWLKNAKENIVQKLYRVSNWKKKCW